MIHHTHNHHLFQLRTTRNSKPVLVGTGQLDFAYPEIGRMTVNLTSPGRRLLKKAKQLTVTGVGTFTPLAQHAILASLTFP
jgi:hypothetical protein